MRRSRILSGSSAYRLKHATQHVSVRLCVCPCICVSACLCQCACVSASVCVHLHLRAYGCVCVRVGACACVRASLRWQFARSGEAEVRQPPEWEAMPVLGEMKARKEERNDLVVVAPLAQGRQQGPLRVWYCAGFGMECFFRCRPSSRQPQNPARARSIDRCIGQVQHSLRARRRATR